MLPAHDRLHVIGIGINIKTIARKYIGKDDVLGLCLLSPCMPRKDVCRSVPEP